jgi:hypothetical protein
LDELSFKRAHFIRSLHKTRDLCPPISTQHVSLAHQITKGWKHTITPNSDTQPTKTHPLSITTSPTQPATTVATNRLASVVGVDLSRQWVTAQTKGLARRSPPDPGGGRAANFGFEKSWSFPSRDYPPRSTPSRRRLLPQVPTPPCNMKSPGSAVKLPISGGP